MRTTILKAVIALGAAAGLLLALPATAFAAGSGYAPAPVTSTPGVPGGFNSVVTTVTVQPSGGTVTATINGTTVSITVPPGAFSQPTQVVVTSGDVTQIGSAGVSGKSAVLAFGISFLVGGQPLTATFTTPISVKAAGNFASSDEVVVYDATTGAWAPVAGASVANGTISFTISSDPDFAVLASNAQPIPGATTPVTGKPFLLEGLIAVLLVLVGGLAAWRFSRPAARA